MVMINLLPIYVISNVNLLMLVEINIFDLINLAILIPDHAVPVPVCVRWMDNL
jgi:hypothetical protein